MPPEPRWRLQCTFPQCLVSFKSQNALTYHIRVVHTNSNVRRPASPEGPDQERADSEGGDDGHSMDLADRRGPVARRIEHPHLTGMCLLPVFI